MGRDKAYLPVGGRNLGARTAETVKAAAGDVVVVGDPERYRALGYRVLADRYPGEGPLGGIVTALEDSAAEWNLIVACDMPQLTVALLQDLLDTAGRKCMEILAPRAQDGRWEPLCAVYRRTALGPLAQAFSSGIRKVTAAFAGLRVEAYPIRDSACFQNLNTPEDWSRYAAG